MEIVIIGTGNAAAVLARKLAAAGHQIVQIYGRNAQAASELAYELDTESTNYWSVVNRNADLYILAVSDIAIAEIMQELALPDKTIVHTAASVSREVLHGARHYGVFYPLQSLKKSQASLPDIPIIIDASDAQTLHQLEVLAASISSKVVMAGDEQRLKIHLAAVFCNNFVNHLYTLTESFCRREGIDFHLLLPLIKETALRLEELSPSEAQTGPAVRDDQNTISRHRELLESYPELKEFYDLFTQSIGVHRK
ncbi:F420-dependent NADP oxidoreductase [Paraflavisolibacter sp. H34]|uniref:Rossmann-like and DUF2520 domain-containing protein n=1 Tax=Huijunlia imazamoxiresistens TaxID=3127457 RepID=UPI00301B3EDD